MEPKMKMIQLLFAVVIASACPRRSIKTSTEDMNMGNQTTSAGAQIHIEGGSAFTRGSPPVG
jgi:hypothetical protein